MSTLGGIWWIYSYFKILAKKEYTSGTESGLGTLWLLFLRWIIENQKSDLVRQ